MALSRKTVFPVSTCVFNRPSGKKRTRLFHHMARKGKPVESHVWTGAVKADFFFGPFHILFPLQKVALQRPRGRTPDIPGSDKDMIFNNPFKGILKRRSLNISRK